jgi:hypothetical protein
MTAFEMRMAAQSSTSDFSDLIVEAAQLDRSIQAILDPEVRLAMLLRTRGGFDEYEIEQMIGSKRPGHQLLKRGVELIRRYARGQHSQLLRVRANQGQSDQPVCWRCLQSEVPRPGDWCGCIDKPWKAERRSKTGPGAPYDPADRPAVSDMTEAERLEEIAKLADTQEKGPIPGGEWYRKKVNPVGSTMFDPNDLRRADREYHRGGSRPSSRPHHDYEQVPGA